MRGKPLRGVHEESDLGVIMSDDLELAHHWKSACKKTNVMLGFIAGNKIIFAQHVDKKSTEIVTAGLVR